MGPHLFWLENFERLPLYIIILTFAVLLHWVFFKKYIMGVLDPLFLLLLGFVFNVATMFFVFIVTDGKITTLLALFTMQMFCYFGFLLIAPSAAKIKQMYIEMPCDLLRPKLNLGFVVLGIGSIVFIFFTVIEYVIAGVPLFKKSYQGVFAGTGMGIITRFEDIGFFFMSLFVARLMMLQDKMNLTWKIVYYLALPLLFVLSVLSGSKGAFLVFFSVVYLLYSAKYTRKHDDFPRIMTRKNLIIMLFVGVSILTSLYINPSSGNVFNDVSDSKLGLAFLGFFYRLINYGDVYIFSFIGDAINSLPKTGGLISLFSGFLGTFRIFSPDDIPVHLGYDLALLAYPKMEYVAGPNACFNVFGLHYFGVSVGLLFSFIIGLLLGWFRLILIISTIAIMRDSKNIIYYLYFILGMAGAGNIGVAVDPVYFSSRCTSLIIVFIAISFLSLPVFYCGKVLRRTQRIT